MEGVMVRVLGPGDDGVLLAADPELFDDPVTAEGARDFLADGNQIMVMAFDGAEAVAFASGALLRHPDKAPSLFVNEVSTLEGHRRRGLGRAVTRGVMDAAHRRWGCTEFWLGTEPDNDAALGLYRAMGGDEGVFTLFAWGFRWDGS